MQQSEIRRWWRVTVCVLLAVLSPLPGHMGTTMRYSSVVVYCALA